VNVRRRRQKAEKEGQSRVNPKAVLVVGGVALGAFLIGYGVTALAFTTGNAATDIALVPDVRQLNLADATSRLRDADLTLAVGDSFPNAEVAAGAVLAQTPLPGQEVSIGSEVRVMVSTGQPRPVVPDVAAMPLAMALRSLQAAGFEVVVEEMPGEGSPGRVVDVAPTAGTSVPLPATVVLRVGAEPLFLWMPPVIGMLEDSARVALEDLGLQITEVRYESTSSEPPYRVLGQQPAPGDSIDPGMQVRLLVSLPEVDRGTLRQLPENRSAGPVYAAGGR
jgi:serine/threonine-protein kinase